MPVSSYPVPRGTSKSEYVRWMRKSRVSSKQTKEKFGSNRNKPKQDLFPVCFGLFRRPKTKNFGSFRCFESIYRNNWNKQNCLETNRNNPKFSEKYQNMLSIKLFRLVFCLFRFNRNIKTFSFSIEPKQLKKTVLKQIKTKRNNPKFCEKIPKYALYHTVSVALLFVFVSVQSKHPNSLFQYRTETTETDVLFRIVPKLVSVRVSVVSNRN